MKTPGPDHPITISPAPQRVRVQFNGRVVADSSHALVLQEANYPPVFYIPPAEAEMALFQRTDHGSHCPYKVDAAKEEARDEAEERTRLLASALLASAHAPCHKLLVDLLEFPNHAQKPS